MMYRTHAVDGYLALRLPSALTVLIYGYIIVKCRCQILDTTSNAKGDLVYKTIFSAFDRAVGYSDYMEFLKENAFVKSQSIDGAELLEEYRRNIAGQLQTVLETLETTSTFIQQAVTFSSANRRYLKCGEKKYPDSYLDRLTRLRSDYNDMCYNNPDTSVEVKYPSENLLTRFRNDVGSITWLLQYFVADEGPMFVYPAQDRPYSRTYDGRFRPFYSYTASRYFRDIAIVVDSSVEAHKVSIGGRSYKEALIESISYVAQALNAKDRITLYVPSSTFECARDTKARSCCIFTKFVTASERTISDIPGLLEDAITPEGPPDYVTLIKHGFDIHKFFSRNTNRNKIVMLFSSARPKDLTDDQLLLQEIAADQRNKSNAQAVHLFVFQLGENKDLSDDIDNLLKSYLEDRAHHDVLDGHSVLNQAGFFYRKIVPYNVQARISFPYRDIFLRGMVVTVSYPVFKTDNPGHLLGVLASDVFFSELVIDLYLANLGTFDYTFLFDREDNITLYHPLLPNANTVLLPTADVHIRLLEGGQAPSKELDAVLDAMHTGQTGAAHVSLERYHFSRQRWGMTTSENASENALWYFYTSINVRGVTWSLCLVLHSPFRDILSTRITPNLPLTTFFHYNASDIPEYFPSSCRFFYVRGSNDTVRIILSENAFQQSVNYHELTKEEIKHLEDIVRGDANNDAFTDGVLEHIRLTSVLSYSWLEGKYSWANAPYTTGRIVGTSLGVGRFYPNILLLSDKNYDVSTTFFYAKSDVYRNQLIIMPALKGELGQGYVVKIGQSVSLSDESENFGFVAMYIPVAYLQQLLEDSNAFCRAAPSRCFLMDLNGYVVSHPSWTYHSHNATEFPLVHNVLVTEIEPDLANVMLLNKQLLWKSCYNIYQLSSLYNLEVAVNRYIEGNGYRVIKIPNSIVYLVEMYDVNRVKSESLKCNCIPRQCTPLNERCGCPCSSPPSYDPCEHTFDSDDWLLCVSVVENSYGKFDIDATSATSIDLDGDDHCGATMCNDMNKTSSCHMNSHCRWCSHFTHEETESRDAFCGLFDDCWLGHVGLETIYPEFFDKRAGGLENKTDHNHMYYLIGATSFVILVALAVSFFNRDRLLKGPKTLVSRESDMPQILLTSSTGASKIIYNPKKVKLLHTNQSDQPPDSDLDFKSGAQGSQDKCYWNWEGRLIPVDCDDPKSTIRALLEQSLFTSSPESVGSFISSPSLSGEEFSIVRVKGTSDAELNARLETKAMYLPKPDSDSPHNVPTKSTSDGGIGGKLTHKSSSQFMDNDYMLNRLQYALLEREEIEKEKRSSKRGDKSKKGEDTTDTNSDTMSSKHTKSDTDTVTNTDKGDASTEITEGTEGAEIAAMLDDLEYSGKDKDTLSIASSETTKL